MIPEYPNFKALSPEDWGTVGKHLALAPRSICELNLINFVLWQEFDNSQLTMINGNLCVLINPLNEPAYFLEPLGGKNIIETIDRCLSHANRLSRISLELVEQLPKGKYRSACLRGQFDYIYHTAELAELKGKKYDGKRNHIKRFVRACPDHHFEKLSPLIRPRALTLFDRWFKIREESRFFPRMAYTAQKAALESAFDNFDSLKLTGGGVFAGGELAGFFIGSALNPNMIDLHFAYAEPDIPGIAPALLQQACVFYRRYELINLEQDLGIPGLRQSKLSYHPLRLEKKFEITA